MKIRIARRSELFPPIALLIPTALGHASEVAALLASYALARLCTFGAAEAFGRAAAQEMSPKRVRGAWTGALFFSLALCLAAWRWGPAVWIWLLAGEPLPADWQALCLTGAALGPGEVGLQEGIEPLSRNTVPALLCRGCRLVIADTLEG